MKSELKGHRKGLNAVVGLEYAEWPDAWKDIFTEEASEKAYEEEVMMAGTGAATVKAEGSAHDYDDMYETYVSRYQHSTIVKAVAVTEEAVEDNLYASVGACIAKAMARSMQYTKEVRRADILNYGFDSNYTGGDSVQLLSTAHPLGGGAWLSRVRLASFGCSPFGISLIPEFDSFQR